jgi:hypothetical protein
MVITVTTGARPTVTLDEPGDFTRFHVSVPGGRDRSRLADAITVSGAGETDGDDGWVRVAWLRTAVAEAASPGWEEGFAAMLGYARRKGWLDDAGASVRAHVEWGDEQADQ